MAVNAASVQAFSSLARVALSIGDGALAADWAGLAAALNTTINAKLWNEELGVYSDSVAAPANSSVAALAFAITSGVAPPDRAVSCLARLSELRLGPGYKDSSAVDGSDASANISPNTNGFLLTALLQTKQARQARQLIEMLWGAMIADESTSSGASCQRHPKHTHLRH